ncbi:MAG: glycosyltransferase [Thermoflexales bacterium]|nr:glycosyltransferase [Thermoflexales bacterium]
MLKLSVIIPTLNEAAYLPALLDALKAQTRQPDEIIVADAGSTDGTADLARARGATVVPGGKPGPGRNAGARVAKGDVFLFFDADVQPPPAFIEHALDEFTRANYAVATCLISPLSGDLADQVIMEALNLYMQVVRPISLRAPGFCILARRDVHQAIGGFDESLKLCEDYDYVQRASRHGEFGILTDMHIPVSMRRLEKEGFTQLAFKYVWCEMHALAGKPVRSTPFDYEFGAFQAPLGSGAPSTGRFLVDIAELRAQLGRFENPIQRLSRAGLDRLYRWVELDPVDATRERFRLLLERADLDTLDHYLRQRLTLVREKSLLTESWSKLKTLPQESIRLLESDWLRSLRWGDAPAEQEDPDA